MQGVTEPKLRLGAWDTGAPWLKDTSYLAAADGIVHVNNAVIGKTDGLTDGANPPTSQRIIDGDTETATLTSSITFMVRKGDYWKVSGNGAPNIFWIPLI